MSLGELKINNIGIKPDYVLNYSKYKDWINIVKNYLEKNVPVN